MNSKPLLIKIKKKLARLVNREVILNMDEKIVSIVEYDDGFELNMDSILEDHTVQKVSRFFDFKATKQEPDIRVATFSRLVGHLAQFMKVDLKPKPVNNKKASSKKSSNKKTSTVNRGLVTKETGSFGQEPTFYLNFNGTIPVSSDNPQDN